MLSQKQFSILLILSMLCLLSSWLLWSNITHKNEEALKGLSLFEQLRRSGEFNYINGLWLIPSGLMFVIFLLILELPSFEDVYKQIKKDIKNKKGEKSP